MKRNSIRMVLMLLLAFSFLGGCGQSAKSGNADGSTGTTSGGSQSGSGFAAGEIQTWIDWNQQGDTVKFTFHLKNQTEHVQTFTFPTGQRFDFVIKNEQGQKVKQYSEGRMFTQMVGEVTLKQAEEISYDAEVKGLPKGIYTVTFWLTDKDLKPKALTEFAVD